MASNRKKVQPPPYNDPGWGDSVSVSKKAREELDEIANNAEVQKQEQLPAETQKKTARLKEYSNYSNATKKTSRLLKPESKDEKSEVTNQVEQLNHEINRAVSEIENVLERFVSQLWSALNNMVLAIYNLVLKVVLYLFIQPLRNAGKLTSEFLHIINESLTDVNNWIGGTSSGTQARQRRRDTYVSMAKQVNTVSEPHPVPELKKDPVEQLPKLYPDVFDGIVFGELARKGIVFLNIKNITLYDENKKDFNVEEEQELLDTAIKEIHNCAKLAKSLPSPSKGKYANRTMVDILENAAMPDLKLFLQYVYTHPKPFIERRLRLSEAFATWAHKGAPV
jgi:hypothetical protein